MFHWVTDRQVSAENNFAERQLRHTVIARKVSFGSQSDKGAKRGEILMSIMHTLKAKGYNARSRLKSTLNVYSKGNNDILKVLFDMDSSWNIIFSLFH